MKISGAKGGMIRNIVKERYRRNAGKLNKDGTVSYFQPFKRISTADFLCKHETFEEGYCKSSSRSTISRGSSVYLLQNQLEGTQDKKIEMFE